MAWFLRALSSNRHGEPCKHRQQQWRRRLLPPYQQLHKTNVPASLLYDLCRPFHRRHCVLLAPVERRGRQLKGLPKPKVGPKGRRRQKRRTAGKDLSSHPLRSASSIRLKVFSSVSRIQTRSADVFRPLTPARQTLSAATAAVAVISATAFSKETEATSP